MEAEGPIVGDGQITVHRGGEQLVLYLGSDEFVMEDGTRVVVSPSSISSATAGMNDVIVRHKARYGLVSLFCRPNVRVLDFPCGSGYAADVLREYDIFYHGRDIDAPGIEFARRHYGRDQVEYSIGDLCSPAIEAESFEVVACIEGLEHIDREYQSPLIAALRHAVKPGGTLIVSSPEAIGASGPSAVNPDHKWELSRGDFVGLLEEQFSPQDIEIVSQRGIVLSTGVKTTCLYGICHRM